MDSGSTQDRPQNQPQTDPAIDARFPQHQFRIDPGRPQIEPILFSHGSWISPGLTPDRRRMDPRSKQDRPQTDPNTSVYLLPWSSYTPVTLLLLVDACIVSGSGAAEKTGASHVDRGETRRSGPRLRRARGPGRPCGEIRATWTLPMYPMRSRRWP